MPPEQSVAESNDASVVLLSASASDLALKWSASQYSPKMAMRTVSIDELTGDNVERTSDFEADNSIDFR